MLKIESSFGIMAQIRRDPRPGGMEQGASSLARPLSVIVHARPSTGGDQIGHSFSRPSLPKVSFLELRVKVMDIGFPPVLSKFSERATT